jgi:RND family efflux transporter MFP subunit
LSPSCTSMGNKMSGSGFCGRLLQGGAVLTAGLLLTGSLSCKSGYPVAAKQERSGEVREVKVARVAQVSMERILTVTGALAALDQATISSKISGRLRTISVDLGSKVRKGQVIAQLEPKDYQLRVQQSEAALAQARARLGLAPEANDETVNIEETGTVRQARALLEEAGLKRERSLVLFRNGVLSQAELDAVEAAYKVAQSRHQDAIEEIRNRQALLVQRRSELELARQQLIDTSISVPFDGVVQEKQAVIGEFLAAGAPVVTIVRMDPLRMRAEVPERDAPSIRTGQEVRVTVEGDSTVHTGNIVRLSPAIATQSRMLVVEAEVRNNGALRPGSFARAEIVADAKTTASAVPTNTIVAFAGIEKVVLIQDGKAVEKPISTGRRSGDWTEVLSGLNVGDTVVINPGNLQSGQTVTVIQ